MKGVCHEQAALLIVLIGMNIVIPRVETHPEVGEWAKEIELANFKIFYC